MSLSKSQIESVKAKSESVENNRGVWRHIPLYGPGSPIAIVLPSHPAKCPEEPNYPLQNRLQSLVIAVAITIIITITPFPQVVRCHSKDRNMAY